MYGLSSTTKVWMTARGSLESGDGWGEWGRRLNRGHVNCTCTVNRRPKKKLVLKALASANDVNKAQGRKESQRPAYADHASYRYSVGE